MSGNYSSGEGKYEYERKGKKREPTELLDYMNDVHHGGIDLHLISVAVSNDDRVSVFITNSNSRAFIVLPFVVKQGLQTNHFVAKHRPTPSGK